MKNEKKSHYGMAVKIAMMLSFASGVALAAPLTPEMAAKAQTTRKQEEQRITQAKKQAAADALKAERLKVHQARQAVQQSSTQSISK
jgi:hypothetical protein